MCKTLADLQEVPREKLAISIKKLEQAAGYPSNDVRLTAEIVGKVHHATRALGLDPSDTTATELYHALKNLTQKHDIFLVKRIGGQASDDVGDLAERIVRLVHKLKVPKEVWAVKHVAIKRLLRQQVPRRAMKQLGYRSLDSLLRREPMGVFVSLLPLLESPRWYDLFTERYQQLTPSDFEQRPVELHIAKGKKWQSILDEASQGDSLKISKEVGVIMLLPEVVAQREAYCLSTLPEILHGLAELRLHSAYLKLMQIRPNFGELVSAAVHGQSPHHVQIADQSVAWRTLHKHLASQQQTPELFEPHVVAEDLLYYRPEEVLYHLEPALHFWHDMDYVGVCKDGQVISFNLIDAAENLKNQVAFGRQTSRNMKESLNDQLLLRYMAIPHLETRVLAQLDYQAFDPELLALAQIEDFS